MCGSGGGSYPLAPMISPAEKELNREYLSLIRQQREQFDILRPLQAKEAGYEPIYGTSPKEIALGKKIDEAERIQRETEADLGPKRQQAIDVGSLKEAREMEKRLQAVRGETLQLKKQFYEEYGAGGKKEIVGIEPSAKLLEAQKRAGEIQTQVDEATLRSLSLQRLRADRQERALRGELPVSEGTSQRKQQEFQLFKENMARSGNPVIGDDPSSAYSLSTAGSQALSEFNKRFGLLEDAERRGEISEGAAALNQTLGLTSDIGARRSGEASTGAASYGARQLGMSGQFLPAYLQGQQPYQFSRSLQAQAGYRQKSDPYLGMAGGAAAGALAGAQVGGIWGKAAGGWGALAGAGLGAGYGYFSSR